MVLCSFLVKRLPFIRALLLLLAFGLPLAAPAQSIAVQNLAVLVDADGSETIASVSAPGAAQRFTPLDGLFSAGYTRKVHWLRFSVQAPAAGPWWLEVMPPFLDDLRLFTPAGAGFTERRSGDRLPFASREEAYRGFIFKLALADSAPHTYYLRLQTTSSSLVTLQLWQPERFQGAKDFDYVVMGFLLGAFVLVLLLNLSLWLSTREPLYGWLSLLVGANLLLYSAFTGLAAQYLLPKMPLLADAAVKASVLIFLGATAPFYRRMLRVERDQKFYFYFFRAMVALPCVLLVSLFTGHYPPEATRIAVSFSGLSALLILYLSSRLLRDDRHEARYLLLAAVLVLMTRIFGALFSLDLLPGALGVNVVHLQRWLPLAVTLIMQVALAVRLHESNEAKRQEAQRALLVERDRLRKEVLEHEARWTGAVDAIGEGIWEWDMASDEMLRSRMFDSALGYAEQDLPLTAEAWVELIHPDDLASNAACLQNYLTGNSATYAIEMRLRTKDGNYRWIACRGTGIAHDAGGAPTRMIGMHTDISTRKQAELKLAQSLAEKNAALERLEQAERFAQATVDAISSSLAILDSSGTILAVNQTWRRINGLGSDQLCEGANYLAVCDAASGANSEGAHEMAAGIRAVIHGLQGEFMLEYPCDSLTEKRWFFSRVTCFHGAGVIRVVVAHEDISERKQIEVARESALELLKNIASRVPGMVFQYHLRVNGSSYFPYASEAIRDIYRVSPEQAFENAANVFAAIHPQDRDAVLIALQQSAADLTPWMQEYREKFDDGTVRWLLGNAVPQRQADGGTIWHGFVTDITARKRIDAQLVAAYDELTIAKDEAESANLAKSRFLATMSHEIRTPMNAVLGMAQVLLQPNISEAKRLDYARTIFSSGQTLLALLNDILDLSKIEAGKVDLEAIALVPALLVGEAKALFAQSAHAKGLGIEAHWKGPERRYLGDPNRLRQMLSNLVGNAIKFTQQGRIRIEASEVACTGQRATLEFSVADSGIGIAKDKQALLFQTFSQADSSTTRHYGGSGLGLSIVRTLAQAMGGEVGVESEVGVGSRFWFRARLDLAPTDEPAALAQATATATAHIGANGPSALLRGRVLVIEDSLVNQKVMRAMLGPMGIAVVLADDGQQGLECAMAGGRVDLILMDLHMPVLDGYGATQRIRQWEAQAQKKRTPIIALSADAFEGVQARCLAAGMDAVLSKPVLLDDLWEALAKWLPAVPADVTAPAASAVGKVIDPAAIIALVNEILPLLALGKADALGRFKALQELVAGGDLAPEMAEVGLPLKEFRFDLALDRLRQMASKYKWKTAP